MDYPRVTEILQPFSGIEFVPKDKLEKAAARGTKVHSICSGMARGLWIAETEIDEELRGYVESFKKWQGAQVESFEIIEKRFTSTLDKFTGQIDFLITTSQGSSCLVDIKTTYRPQKTHPIQLAAYEILLNENKIYPNNSMVVYLSKDGDFPEINFIEDIREPRIVFLSALKCWHYFHKKKGQ